MAFESKASAPWRPWQIAVPDHCSSATHALSGQVASVALATYIRVNDQLNPAEPIHLPNPSYFPILLASGMPLVFYGIIYHTTTWGKALIVLGAILMLIGVVGWATEPLEEPHAAHAEDDSDDDVADVDEDDAVEGEDSLDEEVSADD